MLITKIDLKNIMKHIGIKKMQSYKERRRIVDAK